MEKNKPLVSHLDEKLKNNHETNGNKVPSTIKETIAKNKETIENSRKFLRKE